MSLGVCKCGCGLTYEEAIQDNILNAFPGRETTYEEAKSILIPSYFEENN